MFRRVGEHAWIYGVLAAPIPGKLTRANRQEIISQFFFREHWTVDLGRIGDRHIELQLWSFLQGLAECRHPALCRCVQRRAASVKIDAVHIVPAAEKLAEKRKWSRRDFC